MRGIAQRSQGTPVGDGTFCVCVCWGESGRIKEELKEMGWGEFDHIICMHVLSN